MSDALCNSTNPWLTHSARIDRVIAETPGVATYDLVLDDREFAKRYSFAAGQFNMLYLPGIGEVAISVSGNPADRSRIPQTIREAGRVTHALAQLKAGQAIGLRGPFGTPWPLEQCEGKQVVLIAGGVGLAPLRPAIYHLLGQRDRYDSVSLLYGGRSVEGLLYTREYTAWQAAGIDVQTTVDRAMVGWSGNVGVVTLLLDRLKLSDPENTMLLTCGPEVMMWYVIQTAIARQIAPTSIYVSLERHMNCAIGLCGHCQLGPQFVCKDGPVFRYDQVASIMKVDDL